MSVIIVGGGMTGATLALALSHLSGGQLPVHLVEAHAPESQAHPGFDARAIALAEGTCRLLAQIGIWSALSGCGTAIEQVHVSDRGHAGAVILAARDYQTEALGQVVELHEVGQRLFRLLREAPGVTLHCPDRVAGCHRTQQDVTVTLESGRALAGQVLVAADGSRSPLAAGCGIRWSQQNYDQVAVIANVTTALPHQGRAWERFTPNGPLAMLPMSQNRCSLVWCHRREHQDAVMAWNDERFCEELQRAFGWRLGRITHTGARSSYPLALIRSDRKATHRLALVGNAAQTLHPIAGQGFNLGMRDVMTLAETLSAAWRQGEDIGLWPVLERYQSRRRQDRAATVGVTDGLVQVFANSWAPLVVGRNLGLMAMDYLTPVRNALAHRTLGWVVR
ncbi:2-octaprenyl-6-methoxyphenyl hydroxylase [Erwinia sp. CPCC 100877]|nr:2-octaprenyl-6-methoxyphenyl hydroxylase [Erwinia sp. CPCC 100877]